jgi:hypothetical protein
MKRILIVLMVLFASVGTVAASNTNLNMNGMSVLPSSHGIDLDLHLYSYVANANTGVFHHSSCRYVSRMADYNKVYYNTRKAAINAGYRPCKVCCP